MKQSRYPAIETYVTALESEALALLCKDKLVLEIGSQYGYSTVWMAMHARYVVAVDPHIEHDSWGRFNTNLNHYGVGNKVSVVRASNHEFLPEERPAYDMVFIDGDHSYEECRFDLIQARRLTERGWVAVHDYTAKWPGVKKACDEVTMALRFQIDTLLMFTYYPFGTPPIQHLRIPPDSWLPGRSKSPVGLPVLEPAPVPASPRPVLASAP